MPPFLLFNDDDDFLNDAFCLESRTSKLVHFSALPETIVTPDSHGSVSVRFPSAWKSSQSLSIPSKPLSQMLRNCFLMQQFFHTQVMQIPLYRQIRKLLPSSCFPSPFLILHEHWLYFYSIDPPPWLSIPLHYFPIIFSFCLILQSIFRHQKAAGPL